MTIQERASNYEHDVETSKKKGNDVNANGNGNYDSIDVFEAYKDGATDQKEIDDKELDTIKEFYHQIGYEYAVKKACEYIMNHPTYAVQPEVYAEGLRKAMEE